MISNAFYRSHAETNYTVAILSNNFIEMENILLLARGEKDVSFSVRSFGIKPHNYCKLDKINRFWLFTIHLGKV